MRQSRHADRDTDRHVVRCRAGGSPPSGRFIGKPHPEIYRHCFELLGATPDDRCVAVGDSVEHDIAGGRRAGLATVFVAGGLCAGKSDAELDALYRHFAAEPDWVVPLFRW